MKFITIHNIDTIKLYGNNDYVWLNKVPKLPKILLLGSSTANIGLSPNVMSAELNLCGGEIINLSSSSKSPIQNYYTLQNIEPGLLDSVEVIIYGIDKWIFSKKYYQHNNKLLFDLNLFQLVYLTYFTDNQITFTEFIGIPFYGKLFFPGLSKRSNAEIPPDYGAKIGATNSNRDYFLRPVADWFDRDIFQFSEIQFRYLSKIKEEYCNKKVKMFLVSMPRRSDWRHEYQLHCEDIDIEFTELLKQHLKNTPMIDYSAIIPESLENELFYDSVHLNRWGKQYFSKILCNLVKKPDVDINRIEVKQ
ncbi:MAG: hypothetical protein K9J13_00415 [Saprospiraceae bacterium]|nr:hypothetical protein [Saprospiraceae bacterium]